MTPPTTPQLPCPPEHWPAFSRLLDEALALAAEDRPAWLAALAPPWAHLRGPLQAVLSRTQQATGVPALEAAQWPAGPISPLQAGQVVGPYTLVALLGEGGMGSVWRARRSDGAYERELALKLPHPHLLAAAVQQRFARERDILAALVHPHIATFHDAGLAVHGQPYLAMELVEGVPITTYAQSQALDVPARLRLFLQVLQAVAYAHGRLVAHRDIKPANVLVAPAGQVKLLDFGVAKLLHEQPQQHALTQESQPATPRYAAPEQRLGGSVTVATDIYALGLMLHELLVDQPAWPGGPGAGDEEPRLPSQQAVAPALARALRGDLDAIVHKAVQALPLDRYASAEAFAQDIQRHLDHQPVQARHVSRWIRLRKFVRRHRMPVALGLALVLSLAVGVVGVAWQGQQALEQARRAQAVKGFLVSVFEGADPRLAGNRPRGSTPVRELLDRHAQRIESEFAAEPALRVELLGLVADLYRELGEAEAAQVWAARFEQQATQLFGALHPWVLGARLQQMQQLYQQGQQQACRALGGPVGQDIHRAGLDNTELHGLWLTHWALCHTDQPQQEAQRLQWLAKADQLFARVAPGSRGHVTVRVELANVHTSAGRHEAALQAQQQALAMAQALPRRNEAELQTLHGNIGLTLQQMGRLDESAKAYGEAATAAERTVGLDHPTSWEPRVNHLRTLHLAGQREQAWALLPPLQAATQGAEQRPERVVALANLREHVGERLAAEGRAVEALPWLRSAVALQAQAVAYPFAHRRALRHLGDALDRAGLHAEAGQVLADALRRYEKADQPQRQPVLAARERHARWLLDRGALAQAEQAFQRTVSDAANPHWAHVALAQAGLSRVAARQGRVADALAWSDKALAHWQAVQGFRDVRMQAYLWRVRAAALELQRPDDPEAAALWARALDSARLTDAPQAPTVAQLRYVGL